MKYKATLKTIWGLAKSPELHMTDEELHLFVEARTGKSSLKELTTTERKRIIRVLISLKPTQKKEAERGNGITDRQRKLLQELEKELGWDRNPARLKGLAGKMFGVEALEWLDSVQCSKLIEALKAIKKREEKSRHPDWFGRDIRSTDLTPCVSGEEK